MKILYLITGLGGGGAEKVLIELAEKMISRGYSVKIAYLKGDVVIYPKSTDIELVYLGLEGFTSVFFAYKKYKELLHSYSPDIIHSHMIHSNIFARISRLFFQVPKLICSAHSSNEGGYIRMLSYKLTHNLADITTNVSENASSKFVNIGAVPLGGIETVYNGIDLKKFHNTNIDLDLKSKFGILDSSPIFLAVGRFHDAKDYPNLLKAFAKFKETEVYQQKLPKLVIAGDGELRSEIESLINILGLRSEVILLGRRNDIPALLNISDFFVLSSKYEGLPTVVMEAMACETYVIATDCGGSAEIMGDTGLLVAPQNSVQLAIGLEKSLNLSENDIQKNNYNARLRIEQLFSLETSVKKWLEIYEK